MVLIGSMLFVAYRVSVNELVATFDVRVMALTPTTPFTTVTVPANAKTKEFCSLAHVSRPMSRCTWYTIFNLQGRTGHHVCLAMFRSRAAVLCEPCACENTYIPMDVLNECQ